MNWAAWLIAALAGVETIGPRPMIDHVTHHLAITRLWRAGRWAKPRASCSLQKAGEAAQAAMQELTAEAPHGGTMGAPRLPRYLHGNLNKGEVREGGAKAIRASDLGHAGSAGSGGRSGDSWWVE